MKVSLRRLNNGFPALRGLAMQTLPKDQFKLTWKLGRILKSAQTEIDQLQVEFDKMLKSFGVVMRGKETDTPKELAEYNKAANDLLESTTVDLWGDPFKVDEILGVMQISSEDYSLLDGWLIVGDFEEKTEEKAATTGA